MTPEEVARDERDNPQTDESEPDDEEMRAQKRSALLFALAFPVFFVVMFPLAYITALHRPVIHDFPVGVVGTEEQAQGVDRALGANGMFDFTQVESRDEARRGIFVQDIKAAYVPGDDPTLMISGADGRLAAQFLPQAFREFTSSQGGQLSVVDVAPLASGDVAGIGLMFYMLIPMLVGFVSANILGMAAGWFLSLRTRIGLGALLALLAAFVPWLFMGPWMRIIEGGPAQITAMLALASVVSFIVSLFTTALVEIMGKWAIFVILTIFVFLNIPSSGATFPAEAVPPFFTFLSEFQLGAAFVEGLRSILYYGGAGITTPLLVVASWAVLAVALLAVAVAKNRSDAAKAAESGVSVKETGAAASAGG